MTTTVQDRFEAAVKTITESGTTWALNVMACCPSCTRHEDLGFSQPEGDEPAVPYAWTFGGQGSELLWSSGQPVFREEEHECSCTMDEYEEDEEGEEVLVYEGEECAPCRGEDVRQTRPAKDLYVYHGHDLVAPTTVRDAFAAQGFDVEWDGTVHQAVKVAL